MTGSKTLERVRSEFAGHEFTEESVAKDGLIAWTLYMGGARVLGLTRASYVPAEEFETDEVIDAVVSTVRGAIECEEISGWPPTTGLGR